MKKLFLLMLCAVLVGCHEDLKDRAAREAREYTRKNCPQRFANGLQCDSMVFDKATATMRQYYSVSGVVDSVALFEEKGKELRAEMLQGIRNDVGMRQLKEAGFLISVTIFSQKDKGRKLLDATFTPQEYR